MDGRVFHRRRNDVDKHQTRVADGFHRFGKREHYSLQLHRYGRPTNRQHFLGKLAH